MKPIQTVLFRRLPIAVAMVGIFGPLAAPAGTYTQIDSFVIGPNLNADQTLTVQGFSDLGVPGTLTSVQAVYTLTEDTVQLFAVVPSGSSPQYVTNAQATDTVSLVTPNSPFNLGAMSVTAATPIGSSTGLPNGKSVLISGSAGSLPLSETFSTTTNLASFLNGPFTFQVESSGFASGNTSENAALGASGDITANVEVVYNYSVGAVPEPTSVALLGIGLVGLGAVRRRMPAQVR